MKNKKPFFKIIVVAVIVLWSLFPVYWAFNTSLMTNSSAQSTPSRFIPSPLSLDNYKMIFTARTKMSTGIWESFSRALTNTVIECVIATIVTVGISLFAAYAFVRMEFRFKSLFFYGTIATMSLPAYATLIPLYRILSGVKLVNTYTGILMVYVSGFLPLALWILYNYFHTIPKELEESAFVDGASPLKIMFSIMLPLAGPAIASAAIITFLSAWAQFLFPLILASDPSTQPLTVFMTSLLGRHTVPYTLLNATGVLSAVVPALIVVFLNRHIVSGLVAGSIK
jgi:multiple sugar transport system permease protein